MTRFMLPVALALALTLAQEQVPMGSSGKLKVAGNNPFFYCNDPDPYTLQIAFIDLFPQDPAEWSPGHNITVKIDGHNQQVIEQGALLDLRILKRGPNGAWRPLDSRQRDLCMGLKTMFQEDCPVRAGVSTEVRNFTLPPEVPNGDYYIVIDGHTRFKERITCIHATVSF